MAKAAPLKRDPVGDVMNLNPPALTALPSPAVVPAPIEEREESGKPQVAWRRGERVVKTEADLLDEVEVDESRPVKEAAVVEGAVEGGGRGSVGFGVCTTDVGVGREMSEDLMLEVMVMNFVAEPLYDSLACTVQASSWAFKVAILSFRNGQDFRFPAIPSWTSTKRRGHGVLRVSVVVVDITFPACGGGCERGREGKMEMRKRVEGAKRTSDLRVILEWERCVWWARDFLNPFERDGKSMIASVEGQVEMDTGIGFAAVSQASDSACGAILMQLYSPVIQRW
ncbi:hypothetical protein BKA70DRAFT_1245058 [Coprinopsis sp. MPI-PUGE-AT-0042]|nr:hypothetical protein BKA70DRAFT_1245058 [Coprinopsis sp. MPI-PUGE-AT-0042]